MRHTSGYRSIEQLWKGHILSKLCALLHKQKPTLELLLPFCSVLALAVDDAPNTERAQAHVKISVGIFFISLTYPPFHS